MTPEETVELSNYALDAGADAVMVISPYYFSLSDENVEYFYDEVAANIRGNMFLYNFPDRTGSQSRSYRESAEKAQQHYRV